MSPATPPAPAFPFARSITAMLAVLGVAVAVAGGVLVTLGATAQLVPALAGAVVAATAGVLALLPMRRAAGEPVEKAMLLALAGTGIRLAATLGGVALLIFAIGLEPAAAGIWTLAWYALLLWMEVRTLARYFQSLGIPGSGKTDASSSTDHNDPTASKLVEDRPC